MVRMHLPDISIYNEWSTDELKSNFTSDSTSDSGENIYSLYDDITSSVELKSDNTKGNGVIIVQFLLI